VGLVIVIFVEEQAGELPKPASKEESLVRHSDLSLLHKAESVIRESNRSDIVLL
jgi:hypothetical protein